MHLSGRRLVVIGGGVGLGLAVARRASSRGVRLSFGCRNGKRPDEVPAVKVEGSGAEPAVDAAA